MRRGAPHHLDLNVSDLERSTAFYTDGLGDLGYAPAESGDGWRTLAHTDGWYLCLVQTDEAFRVHGYHRKGVGVNHLAFSAPDRHAVDATHERLVSRGVHVLYGGPRDMGDDREESYAVFFEDPDRVKLEVVARGPRS
jgi:catechol 2,3-dioxygenase-like lactoylglutathione lyase family enzyme